MKTRLFSCCHLALVAAYFTLGTLGASHARAQADLTFSGGNGTPLVLTLDAPVTYAVTTASSYDTPYFDLVAVGNFFNDTSLSGTITYTIAGGAAQTLTTIYSGFNLGVLTPNDAILYGAQETLAVGDIVVLNAGTLTTTGNFAGSPPASGAFTTYITGSFYPADVSTNGVSVVPEPSTWALLGVGAAGLGLGLCRRSRQA